MPTKAELVEQLKSQHLAPGRAIAEKADAEGRELTPAEMETINGHIAAAKSIQGRIRDLGVLSAITDLGNQIEHGTKTADRPGWAVKANRSEWVKDVADRINKDGQARGGAKNIISGSIGVASPIQPGISHLPEYPRRVLDLLVDRQPLADGPGLFSFIRQTVRTDNAAPVADGATKPTSIYTFAEVEDRTHVIAHLSEALPLRYLSDYQGLEQFLADEMERGLYTVVEDELLTGDGTGEHMTGLLETSGVTVQAYATSVLRTLRKASTALEVKGETPNAWVLHPSDVEALDLLDDGNSRMYWEGPQQQMSTGPVWSLPVVKSLAVPAGTAVLGDWTQMRLIVRQDATLDMDTAGVLFEKNQFKARLEGRFGCAVLRPSAFCLVDLTA